MGKNKIISLPATASARSLLPAQHKAYIAVREGIDVASTVQLESTPGQGKTTLLNHLIRDVGGVLIPMRAFLNSAGQEAHAALDSAILNRVEAAFETHDLVAIDDIDPFVASTGAMTAVRRTSAVPLLHMLSDLALRRGKRLVLAGSQFRYSTWMNDRGLSVRIPPFGAEDYQALLESELGEEIAARISEDVFEHAPGLNAHKLLHLTQLAKAGGVFDGETLRRILESKILSANTRIEEVEDLSFSDLKGFDHIAEALTTHVLNPLRGYDQLRGLGLRPKRGVLLYGPPGTGKTSIGRALARQMQGKFFLIDGTFSPEPASSFYTRIMTIFAQAKRAAPCVLFIDDADVLLQSGYAEGYSRFFLSMLDGLESASAGKIAIILTAMDPRKLPPALLRSGRVELWLETKAPAERARGEIIASHVASLPELFHHYDAERVNTLTQGFNAADMRRLVADVKALYATDAIAGSEPASIDAYFERAARNVQSNKRLLQLAEAGRFKFGAQEAV